MDNSNGKYLFCRFVLRILQLSVFCIVCVFDWFYSTYINAILALLFASIVFRNDG